MAEIPFGGEVFDNYFAEHITEQYMEVTLACI